MDDLKFKCFECSMYSPFTITSENRGEVERFRANGDEIGTVRFICTNCGMANNIDIDLRTAAILLERLASEDPKIQEAIDREVVLRG